MAISQRTKIAPNNYTGNKPTSALFSKTYVGFVKDNSDPDKMGRLKVWIPELSSNPQDGTYWCNYMSPFAGASNIELNSSSDITGQTSYGWWAIPPDIDNEVVVMFINGDPNRGIWIGCLYQQFMNNMVPGIPNSDVIRNDNSEPSFGPTTEYNKKDPKQNNSTDPKRPPYQALQDALIRQGLYYDEIRGSSSSSARRDTQSKVLGLLSPKGNSFVIDDGDNSFIRFRTRNGAQILINDTVGNIYFVTKNGNSWLEISDNGIDLYSTGNISYRSQSDINLHADNNVNITAGNSFNMNSAGEVNLSSVKNTTIVSVKDVKVNSNSKIELLSEDNMTLFSSSDLGLGTQSNLSLSGMSQVSVKSSGVLSLDGSMIQQNGGGGSSVSQPSPATIPAMVERDDRQLDLTKGYPSLKTKTNVSRLPTHEPFNGHSASSTGATVSQPSSLSSGGGGSYSKFNDVPKDGSDDVANANMIPNEDWWIPASGKIISSEDSCKISAPIGGNVMASKYGKVIWSTMGYDGSPFSGCGYCVCVDHMNGYQTVYGNMGNIIVSKGDVVLQGQSLGQIGTDGSASYCYFEIRNGGHKETISSLIPKLGKIGFKVFAGKS